MIAIIYIEEATNYNKNRRMQPHKIFAVQTMTFFFKFLPVRDWMRCSISPQNIVSMAFLVVWLKILLLFCQQIFLAYYTKIQLINPSSEHWSFFPAYSSWSLKLKHFFLSKFSPFYLNKQSVLILIMCFVLLIVSSDRGVAKPCFRVYGNVY